MSHSANQGHRRQVGRAEVHLAFLANQHDQAPSFWLNNCVKFFIPLFGTPVQLLEQLPWG